MASGRWLVVGTVEGGRCFAERVGGNGSFGCTAKRIPLRMAETASGEGRRDEKVVGMGSRLVKSSRQEFSPFQCGMGATLFREGFRLCVASSFARATV